MKKIKPDISETVSFGRIVVSLLLPNLNKVALNKDNKATIPNSNPNAKTETTTSFIILP